MAERTERGNIVRKKMMKREDAIGEVCWRGKKVLGRQSREVVSVCVFEVLAVILKQSGKPMFFFFDDRVCVWKPEKYFTMTFYFP